MEQSERKSILQELARGDYFPSPSPVLLRLLNVAADERSSHSEVASIIGQDSGLAARVIRMANSAAFMRKNAVSSISQAILVIGVNRLRLLALTLSLRDSFPLGKVGRVNYEFFWKSSLFRAHAAQGLVKLMPTSFNLSGEDAFTAGLILEIGLLVLSHLRSHVLQASFPEGKTALEEVVKWEEDHFGLNHRWIGEIILRKWHFPEQVIEVQRRFGPETFQEKNSPMCKIVELARISTEIFFGEGDGSIIEKAASVLGLLTAQVSATLLDSFSKVEETASYLSINVQSDKDILDAMEKANRALDKFLFTKPTEGFPGS